MTARRAMYVLTVMLLAMETAMEAEREDRAAHFRVVIGEGGQVHHFLSAADALLKSAKLAKKLWGLR